MYRARGNDVQAHRPIFTGDVYTNARVQSVGEEKTCSVMILQHPCTLRTDGVALQSRLVVARVRNHPLIPAENWTGHIAKMPLPDLNPTVNSGRRHQAAFFDEVYLVSPERLDEATRIACLSQVGVNLLLQRWVHHNSRVTVPTWRYQESTGGQYEESDLTEEWCEERMDAGVSIADASVEALKWLRAPDSDGVMRQARLEDPQQRSAVRRDMRAHLRSLRTQ